MTILYFRILLAQTTAVLSALGDLHKTRYDDSSLIASEVVELDQSTRDQTCPREVESRAMHRRDAVSADRDKNTTT